MRKINKFNINDEVFLQINTGFENVLVVFITGIKIKDDNFFYDVEAYKYQYEEKSRFYTDISEDKLFRKSDDAFEYILNNYFNKYDKKFIVTMEVFMGDDEEGAYRDYQNKYSVFDMEDNLIFEIDGRNEFLDNIHSFIKGFEMGKQTIISKLQKEYEND